MNAGAPFLFFAALVATAVVVAATIHTDAGKGHAHMAPLFADDPEADPEVDADCQNLAGLPLPAVDARAGGDGAELLDGLLAKHGASRHRLATHDGFRSRQHRRVFARGGQSF